MAEKKKDDKPVTPPLLKDILRVTWGNPLARTILEQLKAGTNKNVSVGPLANIRTLTIPQINRQVLMSVRKPSQFNDLKMPEVNVSFSDLKGNYPNTGLTETGRAALQWALGDHASVGPRNRASYDLKPLTTGRARLYRRWFQGLRRGSETSAPVFPYSRNTEGVPIQRGNRAGNIWQSRNATGQYGPQVNWNPNTAKQALEALAATPLVTRRLGQINPYIQGVLLAEDTIKQLTGKSLTKSGTRELLKILNRAPTMNYNSLRF